MDGNAQGQNQERIIIEEGENQGSLAARAIKKAFKIKLPEMSFTIKESIDI